MQFEEPKIGLHTTCFEEPDIIYMQLVGPCSYEEGHEVNLRHLRYGEEHDRLFFLIDLEKLENIDPAVRKEAGLVLRSIPLRGAALYKAPLKARVIAKLILTAMNTFRRPEEKVPVVFVDTEEQARAWIDERRRELDAGLSPAVSQAV
jgi:hypothetical protein